MAVTQATTLADFTSGIGTAGAVLQEIMQIKGLVLAPPIHKQLCKWVLPLRWMAPLVLSQQPSLLEKGHN